MKKLLFGLAIMCTLGLGTMQAHFFNGQCFVRNVPNGNGGQRTVRVYLLHDVHLGTSGIQQQNALVQEIAARNAFAIIEDRESQMFMDQEMRASGASDNVVLTEHQKDAFSEQFLHTIEQKGSSSSITTTMTEQQIQLMAQVMGSRMMTPLVFLDFYLRRAKQGGASIGIENIECRTSPLAVERSNPTCRDIFDNIIKACAVLDSLSNCGFSQSDSTIAEMNKYKQEVIEPLYRLFNEACITSIGQMNLSVLYGSTIFPLMFNTNLLGFFNPIMESLTRYNLERSIAPIVFGDLGQVDKLSACLTACLFAAIDFNIIKSFMLHRRDYDNFVICAGSAHTMTMALWLAAHGFEERFSQGDDPCAFIQALGAVGLVGTGLPRVLGVHAFFAACP